MEDIVRTPEDEERLAKLKKILHSLATRIPKIVLKNVEETFPSLETNGVVTLNDNTGRDLHDTGREVECKNCTNSFLVTDQDAGWNEEEGYMCETCIKGKVCEICKLSFQREDYFVRHQREKHGLQRKYPCDTCKRIFSRLDKLNAHKCRIVTEGKGKMSNSAVKHGNFGTDTQNLSDNTGTDPNEASQNIKCKRCKKTFPYNEQSYHKFKNYFCKTCNVPYSCELCTTSFRLLTSLKRHRQEQHGPRKHACNLCETRFGRLYELTVHLKQHEQYSVRKKIFTCHVCKRSFVNRKQLEKHESVYHQSKDYSCYGCKGSFPNRTALMKHECLAEIKKQSCNICKMSFTGSREFFYHKKICKKSLYCTSCKKLFPSLEELQTHECTCGEQQSYVCTVCKKLFVKRTDFEKHLLVHAVEKVFLSPDV